MSDKIGKLLDLSSAVRRLIGRSAGAQDRIFDDRTATPPRGRKLPKGVEGHQLGNRHKK